ncbi:MAG: NifB/NifX family molybdenum-iron cluster-binding protein [Candidatus Bathyarchaeia archaeon]|jgi:predicted Fe-Mo cluster-binding NifX family protein
MVMKGTEDARVKVLEELRQKKETVILEHKMSGGERLRKVVIPTEDGNGLNATLSEHFGRAPYFVVIELSEDGDVAAVQTVANESEHFGGTGSPPDRILQFKPDAVITYGMGPRALNIFQGAGVAVLRTDAVTVKEAIDAYKRGFLVELTEGCQHAHHH